MCEIISKEIMRICGKMKKQFVSCLIFHKCKNKISHVSLSYCKRLHVYSYLNLMLLHACKKKLICSCSQSYIYFKILVVDKRIGSMEIRRAICSYGRVTNKCWFSQLCFIGEKRVSWLNLILDSWYIYTFMYKLL